MRATRRRRLLLLVAALVALAGCSAPAAPTGTTTPTATATAAPVPTDRPSTFLAPGVTPRGVESPAALVAAHERTLRGTSVTVRVELSHRYENGSLRWRRAATQRLDATADPVRSYYVGEFEGPASGRGPSSFVRFPDATRVERYTVGDGVYHRYRLPSGGVSYVGGGSSDVRPLDPGLAPLFRAVETRVVGREAGVGPARYRLVGTGVADPGTLARLLGVGPLAELRNVSFEATVDAEGTVHGYWLRYTVASVDGVRVHGWESVRFTGIGATTVEQPDWYGAAVNATGDWDGEDGDDEEPRARASGIGERGREAPNPGAGRRGPDRRGPTPA
jgi:hypothetical protein